MKQGLFFEEMERLNDCTFVNFRLVHPVGVMVEHPKIFWRIYGPLMAFIICIIHIMATTKRIIEKIKEYQEQNVVNMIQNVVNMIQINLEGSERLSGGIWSF